MTTQTAVKKNIHQDAAASSFPANWSDPILTGIPNAATLEAMREFDDGGGEVTAIDKIMAELNA
jgi:hypothetical protein